MPVVAAFKIVQQQQSLLDQVGRMWWMWHCMCRLLAS
jgi:hypothetical protein